MTPEALVLQHMELPAKVVGWLINQGQYPKYGDTHDDWRQVAAMALMKAAETWREDGGQAFPSYAWTRMHGAILDHQRSTGRAEGMRRVEGKTTRIAHVGSLDAPVAGIQDDLTLAEILPDDFDEDNLITGIDLEDAICALWRFDLRLANVVALHIFEDWTQLEIAEVLGITESRVSQLLAQGRAFMAERLAA